MQSLEPELLGAIFQLLEPQDLCRVAACCKQFRSIVAMEPLLWPQIDIDTTDDAVIPLLQLMRTNCMIPCALGNVARLQLVDQCASSQGDPARLGMMGNDSCSDFTCYWLAEGRSEDRIAYISRWLWSKRCSIVKKLEPSQQDKLKAKMLKMNMKDIVSSEMEKQWLQRWERARMVVMSLENCNLAATLTAFWNQVAELGHVDEMDTIDIVGLQVDSSDSDEMSISSETTEEITENLYDSLSEYPASQEAKVLRKLTFATELLLANLDQNPSHVASLYMLSFIAYLGNAAEACLDLLNLLKEIDPEYEPALELERELQAMEASEDSGVVSLLDESGLNLSLQLNAVVESIFERLDQDKDGYLSPKDELVSFFLIANPNQEPPPLNILLTMCRNYNSADRRKPLSQAEIRKGLTLDGLKKFYYVQSGEDEAETRRDLEKFGFNGTKLNKL